jgi:peroxiredoxin Q/BCP
MATGKTTGSFTGRTRPGAGKATAPDKAHARRSLQALAQTRRRSRLRWFAGVVVVVVAIGVLYAVFHHANNTASAHGAYQVGQPGPGAAAPGFDLAASTGRNVSLADYRGKSVLLYFQEGLTCQPCWDQLTALQQDSAPVKAAGVDAIVSITTDPANLIARKTRDMRITIPVLSDPNLAVSKRYHANDYGMMGTSRDGHTFILVGPNGVIRWRADYGGAPHYTMFVKPAQLLADLRAGEQEGNTP